MKYKVHYCEDYYAHSMYNLQLILSFFQYTIKLQDIIIRILSGSNPLMVRDGLWTYFLLLLMPNVRDRLIVNLDLPRLCEHVIIPNSI
jgi:hypothetical protein